MDPSRPNCNADHTLRLFVKFSVTLWRFHNSQRVWLVNAIDTRHGTLSPRHLTEQKHFRMPHMLPFKFPDISLSADSAYVHVHLVPRSLFKQPKPRNTRAPGVTTRSKKLLWSSPCASVVGSRRAINEQQELRHVHLHRTLGGFLHELRRAPMRRP